jgi:HPt (histidine-containing phosphotransfer) domain-containing protein
VNDSLDIIRISLLSSINEKGAKEQQHLKDLAKGEEEFPAALDRYEKEFSVMASPVMQDLLRQFGALEDQMSREVEIFLRETTTQITALSTAISQDNKSEIRRLAHLMKGSSANLGVQRMAALFNQLEHSELSSQEMNRVLTQLEDEFARARDVLEKLG